MRPLRGQVSAEFAAILGIQLFIIALLAAIFGSVVSQVSLRTQHTLAHDSVLAVADAAKASWAGGTGSLRTASIAIPENAVLASSYIANYTINVNLLSYGDVSAAVPFLVNGSWPTTRGTYLMSAYNNGTAVIIKPAVYVTFNKSAVYLEINTSNKKNYTLVRITNNMPVSYNVTPSPQYCNLTTGMNCTIIPYQVYQIDASSYYDVNISLNSTQAGLQPGNMNFSIIPTSDPSYPTSSFNLPITARVYS